SLSVLAIFFSLSLRPRPRPTLFPYTTLFRSGLGLFGISGDINKTEDYSNVQASIPFGGGVKYVYNPKWYFSLEFGIRKTFFDHLDRKSTRLNSSHVKISYAVFCLKKKITSLV